MTLKTNIKWQTQIDEDDMFLESAMVNGVSCAHSSGMGEEMWSFNSGQGRTHYFKTEDKFLSALTAQIS